MRQFTKEEIHEILEMQNDMALEGHDVPFERCAAAFLRAEAEAKTESAPVLAISGSAVRNP
jgi:hypothetical protein